MTSTFIQILVSLVSVALAVFVVKGLLPPQGKLQQVVQTLAGALLVLFFLTVWARTGRDPLQWAYCYFDSAAPSCLGMNLRQPRPSGEQLLTKPSLSTPPHPRLDSTADLGIRHSSPELPTNPNASRSNIFSGGSTSTRSPPQIAPYPSSTGPRAATTTSTAAATKPDGIFVDTAMKLMWQDNGYSGTEADSITYYSSTPNGRLQRLSGATAYCASLDLSGYSDWRLPTLVELRALYRRKSELTSFKPNRYWTSSFETYTGRSDGRKFTLNYNVLFSNGKEENNHADHYALYVRCARPL